MRDYGKIFCAFWSAGDIQTLSDQGKILAAYLLTSQHTTLLGCFRAPFGYIQEDLKWGFETVQTAFSELSRNGFATVDEPTGWVLIHKYLFWNPIENPNQGKQAVRLYDQIPAAMPLMPALKRVLAEYGRFLPDEFLKGLGTVSKPFLNQEQEQEQEQEKEVPPTPAVAVAGKRRGGTRNLGDYPGEMLQGVKDYRTLMALCRTSEILNKFPAEQHRFVAKSLGANEATWKAWQNHLGSNVHGAKVTNPDILEALLVMIDHKRKNAEEGQHLAIPMLPSLLNQPLFVDALVRVMEVAHAS